MDLRAAWRLETDRGAWLFACCATSEGRPHRSDTVLRQPRCGRLFLLSGSLPAAHCGRWTTADHSSSSPSSSFGAGPFLAVPSLAAMRFSMTRWRISANIAGFSLMNALAFSRPWPMRVVL